LSLCVDSSFLASLYIRDRHLSDVLQRMEQKPVIWINPLNRVEVSHAIYLHVFRKAMSTAAAQTAWERFESDCASGLWAEVDFSTAVWERSISLARRFGPILGVRTLDSLHVACALELGAEKFWTFDERQERLANAVGLDIRA
jgi:predicted nucleic acid-binding protein